MPNTFKVLGQSAPAATTETTLYTVPSATQVVVNTLTCCNRGTSSGMVRVAIRPNGAAIASEHYVVYDTTIAANDSLDVADLVPPIDATDVVTVRASTANFSFTIGGCEITA
jgi:hypothetical protein